MAENKANDTTPAIYKGINGVMVDVGAVKKDKVNQKQGFKFRGIDEVMNALYPAMTKHKIFVVPEILEQSREERKTNAGGNLLFSICKIRYTFYAEDGSFVQAVVIGEGMDSGDKATNKAMAVAFKYACFQVFCIPTEEMKDPDEDIAPPSEPKKEEVKEPEKVTSNEPVERNPDEEKVKGIHIRTIKAELDRTGTSEAVFFTVMNIASYEDMSMTSFNKAMKKFEKTPDKVTPEKIEEFEGELPFK